MDSDLFHPYWYEIENVARTTTVVRKVPVGAKVHVVGVEWSNAIEQC